MNQRVTLGELCNIEIGKTPPRNRLELWGGGEPFLSIMDMNQGRYISSTRETISKEAAGKYKCRLVPSNTLLLSFKLSIGKVGFTTKPLYTNEAIAALYIKDDCIFPDYLFWTLKTTNFDKYADPAAKGKTLNKRSLQSIEIPLPPLSEQRRIAAILDKVDELRAKRWRALGLLDDLVQSVFTDMFGDPTINEKKWPRVSIEEIAASTKHSIKAGPFGSSLKKETYVKEGYKIYGQEQVIRDNLDYGEYYISQKHYDRLSANKIQAGDILISLVGTFGKVSVVPDNFHPGIINPRLMKLTVDKSKANPIFLKTVLLFPSMVEYIKNLSHGGTMDIVNVGILKKVRIPLPPLLLQFDFVRILEKINSYKQKLDESLSRIDALYSSLQLTYFNGE